VDSNSSHPILLFDGVCNLCNRSVQFVLKHDQEKIFRFASLQSNAGQALLQQFNLPLTDFNSFVLVEGEQVFTKSTGALKVARQLKGWRWLYGFIIIPRFIRDAVYGFIARNRYRWFGKQESCWLPTPELRARFLE
jgi:predicted DCC family thiol-disulfide oxidoreductase YuxK